MSRYPNFGSLGPPYAGLGSLGQGLLARDISPFAPLPPNQDHWQRYISTIDTLVTSYSKTIRKWLLCNP